MAQTPKSLSSKKATASLDNLGSENPTDANIKTKSITKKTRGSKPRMQDENKDHLSPTQTEQLDYSMLLDNNKSTTKLDLGPSNLQMVTETPINQSAANNGLLGTTKMDLINSDSPASIEPQGSNTNQLTSPPEFAGFIIPSGCGNVLKAEREAQGLSLTEVCKSLRLSVKQIQAIEQDDFVNLPKQSIVRGFIRNYARLLKMDAEPILKAFQNIVPDEAPLSLSVKATADEAVIGAKELKLTPKIIINILLTIAILFALSYLYTHFIKPKSKLEDGLSLNADEIQRNSLDMMALPLPSPNNQLTVEVPTTNGLDVSNANASPAISSDLPLPSTSNQIDIAKEANKDVKLNATFETNPTQNNQPSTNKREVSDTVVTTNTTSNSNPNNTAKINDSNLNLSKLNFKLSGESWIRVETPDGKTIFSDLLPKDSNQTLSVQPPFNIIVGNAGVTKVFINNQDYDLTPVTRSNVARVQIK